MCVACWSGDSRPEYSPPSLSWADGPFRGTRTGSRTCGCKTQEPAGGLWPAGLAGPPYPCGVPGSVVDLILLGLIIMFGLNGYRQGFLVGALSFFGFFGGALVGLQLAPLVVERLDQAVTRVIVSLLAVFGL